MGHTDDAAPARSQPRGPDAAATRPGAASPDAALGQQLRRAMLDADPALSRYDPLPRILVFDQFNS
ncbi:MAG: hypothetical protein ACRDT8_18960, partial [Micromonosporaceae bacterium]